MSAQLYKVKISTSQRAGGLSTIYFRVRRLEEEPSLDEPFELGGGELRPDDPELDGLDTLPPEPDEPRR
jgi:hypothetical protein